MKAVIPAAGFGTRFLPLTKAQPKEMLPVVNKPTIQWVIEEAVDAGITDIAIITGKHKQAILPFHSRFLCFSFTPSRFACALYSSSLAMS